MSTRRTGWSIVVENRAGAEHGNIGLEVVAKAAPDRYPIGMNRARRFIALQAEEIGADDIRSDVVRNIRKRVD